MLFRSIKMKKRLFGKVTKKAIALTLSLAVVMGSFSGCGTSGGKSGKPITLTVYSQLANYSGEQVGWSAQLLKEKFNVVLNIIPDNDGVLETRMESGNLGDIVIWGSDDDDYMRAVDNGMLYDWEEDNLLEEFGPVIKENMSFALEKNRSINSDGKIHRSEERRVGKEC